MPLQHLRSSTANKRPTPGAMSDGQLALNTNLASPGLFFKDSNGDAIKIGPVHVGATAPNVSPGVGGQAGNSKGEQWLDTSSSRYVFKIWDGTAWRSEDGEFVNTSGDLMTGALGIIAGTVSAPGVYFSGDTNTGIYSPGADQVAVATNGTERLRITSAGLVGIGTTSPGKTLDIVETDVVQTPNASSPLVVRRSAGVNINLLCSNTGDAGIVFGDTDNAQPGRIVYSHSTDALQLWTSNTERMRIRSDGNIGIGGVGAATVTLYNQAPITGGTIAYSNYTQSTIQSDVTTTALGYATSLTTAAAAFTLASLQHYVAAQGAFGAGSTVTSQYGFLAGASLIGATNNYGFFSNIPAATGRWNFYANNTAPNYFAGDVRTDTVVTTRQAPTNSNTTATVATAASLIDGLRTSTPTADITLLVPTGTSMDAAFQELQTNQSFEWSLINLATAASGFDVTVTANTTHTVVGRMVVTGETSGRFLTRKTAANTFITYRIA